MWVTTGHEPTLADLVLLRLWRWNVRDRTYESTRQNGWRGSLGTSDAAIVPILSLLSPFSPRASVWLLGALSTGRRTQSRLKALAGPAPDKGFPAVWSKPCFDLRARPEPR